MMRRSLTKAAKVSIAALCLAALTVGAVRLVQNKQSELADAPRYGLAPTPVRVSTARLGSLHVTRGYLAIVEPMQTANFSARLTSQVESVAVEEGTSVKAGEPLILLDTREITDAIGAVRAQIAQAEAELAANEATVSALTHSAEFWEREANRLNRLRSQDAASHLETENAIDQAKQLAGQLQAARHKSRAIAQQVEASSRQADELSTRLSYGTITSPFDGIVARRHVDPGDLAVPGKTLLVVEDRSGLKLAFDVPQQDLPHLRPGRTVRFKGYDQQRHAMVTRLFPSLNPARMLRAEVELEGPQAAGLDSGAYLPITVVLETHEDVSLVPSIALVESPAGESYVFVVTDGVLEPVDVTILGQDGDETAVQGIEPGTTVVLSTFLGWSRLSAGLPVEAIR